MAALLDTETPVDGVTAGKLRPELKTVGVVARVGGGSLNTATELDVTARWGVAGKGGVCMPGKGKAAERKYEAGGRYKAFAAGLARPRHGPGGRPRLPGRDDLRHLPQRRGLLAERAGSRLVVHAGRLSGHEEMALLPREDAAGPRPDAGGK